MRLRGPTASFCLALLIVSGATVLFFVSPPGDLDDWPPLALPIKPAFWLAFGFGGGPQGIASNLSYLVVATFAIALAMWWATLEGCRGLWNALRT